MSTVTVGQRIKELRMMKSLTQMDLGKDICTPSMVSQIESDRARPSINILCKLAERLEVPFDQLLSNVELKLEFFSTYKMAKAMMAAKEYSVALPLLRELSKHPRPLISKAEVNIALGECLARTGSLDEAEELFTELQRMEKASEVPDLLQQVATHLGWIEMERKNYTLAIYHWKRALEELAGSELVDPYQEGGLIFNIGLAHTKLGKVKEAASYYEKASDLYKHPDQLQDLGKVYLNLGETYRSLHDYEKATEYAERATGVYHTLDNLYMKVKLQLTSAVVYGETGRVKEAVRLLETVISKFQELGKIEDVGIAYVELAKIQLDQGQASLAYESCQTARSCVPELHLYQGWVKRLLGTIAMQKGQHKEALRYLQQAAELFKHFDEIAEWEAAMYDISKLYVVLDDSSQAFAMLEAARGYTLRVLGERGIVL